MSIRFTKKDLREIADTIRLAETHVRENAAQHGYRSKAARHAGERQVADYQASQAAQALHIAERMRSIQALLDSALTMSVDATTIPRLSRSQSA